MKLLHERSPFDDNLLQDHIYWVKRLIIFMKYKETKVNKQQFVINERSKGSYSRSRNNDRWKRSMPQGINEPLQSSSATSVEITVAHNCCA